MANATLSSAEYIAKIKELEAEIQELREKEKIIDAIQKSQEEILHRTTILVAMNVLHRPLIMQLYRQYAEVFRRVLYIIGRILGIPKRLYALISHTFVGKFYRKFKDTLRKLLF